MKRMTRSRRLCLMAAVLLLITFAGMAFATDGEAEHVSSVYATFWSLLPPIIAIALALITKEVYSSLFVGILVGALLYANFNLELAFTTMLNDGFVMKLADSWNVGILIFLVILGILVVVMNKAGGSAAYGAWAREKIKSRKGAILSTFALGVIIFVDDYFNCLTVGSVMQPVTDRFRVSRAKLSYIIDATAAPICMIAPISSWAAAVSSSVEIEGIDGLTLFIQAIPYNFYSLLTITMIIVLTCLKFDFGPMRLHEMNAIEKGDLFTTDSRPYGDGEDTNRPADAKGKVIDLVLPVIVLVVCCVLGMVYTGGFFHGTDFITAFVDCDAAAGLALGSMIALILIFVYYMIRRVLTFQEFMKAIPEGFKAMVPAILILTFAWTLSAMTGLLGGAEYVGALVEGSAEGFRNFLPAIVFVVSAGLAFATGTSWGTFAIMLPIVAEILDPGNPLLIIAVSACLAGAVCGDHCSPISDTTIMASTGGRCDHVVHVATQLPYALFVAGVSFVFYIVAGFVQNWLVVLPIALIVMVALLFGMKKVMAKK